MAGTKKDKLRINETHFQVEEIAFYPFQSATASRYVFNIPNPIIPGEELKNTQPQARLRTAHVGKTTNLPMRHFFGVLLLRNEIQAVQGKPLNREQLRRELYKEYPTLIKECGNFFKKFSDYRRAYILGTLHANQQPPLLYPLFYVDGYVRHQTYRSQFVGFEFVRRLLIAEKFADPRFFKPEELNRFRFEAAADKPSPYDTWTIPSEIAVSRLEAELNKKLFNSLDFPPGYERGRHPI